MIIPAKKNTLKRYDFQPPARDFQPMARDFQPPARDFQPMARDFQPPARELQPLFAESAFDDDSDGSANETGSATGEFVLIALPLFLPALLFFLAISQIARSEMEASFIAREAVRAFTTGSNDDAAHSRVRALLREYDVSKLSYRVICSAQPCISPGAEVELTVIEQFEESVFTERLIGSTSKFWNSHGSQGEKSRRAIASARGFVDKWQ